MKIRWNFGLLLVLCSLNAFCSIDPISQQMVNLNIQMKGKKSPVRTDLVMPFYQSAEIEKKIDDKEYTFLVNPKKGKNDKEINVEIKMISKKTAKVIYKKELKAKMNRVSFVNMKGLTIEVMPKSDSI